MTGVGNASVPIDRTAGTDQGNRSLSPAGGGRSDNDRKRLRGELARDWRRVSLLSTFRLRLTMGGAYSMRYGLFAILSISALSTALEAQTAPAVPAPAPAAPRAFAPGDWYKVTTLGNPAMSPDGKWVAVTVTTVREAENKRHTEVWVVGASGGEPQRFTSPAFESSNPRWSPDGKWLLFASQRPGARGRTWGLRMDQPGGEAVETDRYPDGSVPNDKSFIVWTEGTTPDSSAADSTRRDLFASMQPMSRPPFGAITKPLDPKRFDGRHITEMRYKSNGPGFLPGPREKRIYRPSQIWMQKADGSKKKLVDSTAYSRRDAVVSPDGKWIAFTADAQLRPDSVAEAERDSLARLPYNAKRDEAPRNDNDIFVIPIGGGTPRRVASLQGNEGDLAWSPDGKWISFSSAPTRVASQRLYVIDPAGGAATNLLGTWQYELEAYEWTPDGHILFSAPIGGRSAIFQLDPATKQMKELVGGRRQLRGFSIDEKASKVAYVATSMDKPTELFVANADGSGEKKVTGFNDALLQQVTFSDAERFTYKSVGNLEVEGWLMKPYGYQPGKKYPMALYIHGGPHGQYGEGWFDEFQNLAAAGMWVLFTNPRGSSGYGGDFTYATRGRWFAEDYQDLMKAVDIAAVRPDVDSTHMGVTGGSYGGVMTAWVTAKTTRFKAAQTDRMISNWWSWYGTSDAQGLTEFEFYGKPWDNPAMYDSLSPIRFIRRVKTPTLMVQSEDDHRTPMTDAEQWYVGLKKQGTPVELVRYPRSTHDLSRTGEPWLLVDRLARLRQWFSYWLIDTGGSVRATSDHP
ncbi:MAG: S9 family peptidase [Gemmatimonadaceae bacterium]